MLAYAGWLVHKERAPARCAVADQHHTACGGIRTDAAHELRARNLHWDGTAFPNSAGGVLGELVGEGPRRRP